MGALESHNYVSDSDEEKTKLCRVIKMVKAKLRRECVLLGHGNVEHAGHERKGNYFLQYHSGLILHDVELK